MPDARDYKFANIPRAGEIIAGKYAVEKVIGKGGMGVVLSAEHLTLRERVALKVLLPAEDEDKQASLAARFLREAQAVVKIKNEHVARVLDFGTTDRGLPFMVMELLEGEDLNRHVRKNGPLPIADAVEYVVQACEAVNDAHTLGIVHRDLKPANLFLSRRLDGSPLVKVLDFGISKVTREGELDLNLTSEAEVLGSPLYMSPEQIRNPKGVDLRTDLWSLGAILYKLLTGRALFEADSPSASLAMIVTEDPPRLRAYRPDAPAELDAVLSRCLEHDLSKRWQRADELSRALAPFAGPQRARFADAPDKTLPGAALSLPAPKRRAAVWVIGAILGVAIMAGAAIALTSTMGGPKPPKVATANGVPSIEPSSASPPAPSAIMASPTAESTMSAKAAPPSAAPQPSSAPSSQPPKPSPKKGGQVDPLGDRL